MCVCYDDDARLTEFQSAPITIVHMDAESVRVEIHTREHTKRVFLNSTRPKLKKKTPHTFIWFMIS